MALNTLSNIVADTNKLQLIRMPHLNFMGSGAITTDNFITRFGAQFGIGQYVLVYEPTQSLYITDMGQTISGTMYISMSSVTIGTLLFISASTTNHCKYYVKDTTTSWVDIGGDTLSADDRAKLTQILSVGQGGNSVHQDITLSNYMENNSYTTSQVISTLSTQLTGINAKNATKTITAHYVSGGIKITDLDGMAPGVTLNGILTIHLQSDLTKVYCEFADSANGLALVYFTNASSEPGWNQLYTSKAQVLSAVANNLVTTNLDVVQSLELFNFNQSKHVSTRWASDNGSVLMYIDGGNGTETSVLKLYPTGLIKTHPNKIEFTPSSGLAITFTQSYVHMIPGAAIYNIIGKSTGADGIAKASGTGICNSIPSVARPPENIDTWIFAQNNGGNVVRCTATIKKDGTITTAATAPYTYFRINCVVPVAY